MTPERLVEISKGSCPTLEEWRAIVEQLGKLKLDYDRDVGALTDKLVILEGNQRWHDACHAEQAREIERLQAQLAACAARCERLDTQNIILIAEKEGDQATRLEYVTTIKQLEARLALSAQATRAAEARVKELEATARELKQRNVEKGRAIIKKCR